MVETFECSIEAKLCGISGWIDEKTDERRRRGLEEQHVVRASAAPPSYPVPRGAEIFIDAPNSKYFAHSVTGAQIYSLTV